MINFAFVLLASVQAQADAQLIKDLSTLFSALDSSCSQKSKNKIIQSVISFGDDEVSFEFHSKYESNVGIEIDKRLKRYFNMDIRDSEFYVFRLYRGHLTDKNFDLRRALKIGRNYGLPPKPKPSKPLTGPIPLKD